MGRVRYNNALGTLGAAMLSTDTTISFGSAPAFATLATGDYVPLVLDPPASPTPSTSYEIVHLTAYTSGALTGTIARAQEGTTAVAHGNGSIWMCGPTAQSQSEAVYSVTAADDTITVDDTDPSNPTIKLSPTALPVSLVPPPSGVPATDTANITAALSALGGKGGIVQFCAGTYYDTSQRVLPNYTIFQGAGGLSAGAIPGTLLEYYNGTATPYISGVAKVGAQVRDMMVLCNSASFTGTVIDLSGGSSLCRVRDCYIGAADTTTAVLINLDQSQTATIDGCNIVGGKYGVQGVGAAGHISTVHSILSNRIGGQGAVGACILGPGSGWTVQGNSFELQNGQHAIAAGASPFTGLTFHGNWLGDNPAAAGVVAQLFGSGASIRGNLLGGNTGRTILQFTGTSDGIEIAGNRFDTGSLGIDKNSQTVTNVQLGPNSYTNVTTHHNFTAAGSPYVEA